MIRLITVMIMHGMSCAIEFIHLLFVFILL